MIWRHPALTDERLPTPRLELVPVVGDDAEELTEVFADERLYVFLASHPTTTEELRTQFDRLAGARLVDKEGTAQRNWAVRRRSDGRAVGMVQAAYSDQGRAAEIAWAVGVPWQCQGIASEAARAVVGWLEQRGVVAITAHIHPDHHASAKVATRTGLRPTDELRDTRASVSSCGVGGSRNRHLQLLVMTGALDLHHQAAWRRTVRLRAGWLAE